MLTCTGGINHAHSWHVPIWILSEFKPYVPRFSHERRRADGHNVGFRLIPQLHNKPMTTLRDIQQAAAGQVVLTFKIL
jgi:hypothetical protein